MTKKLKESQEIQGSANNMLHSNEFEGILDILNTNPEGYREFCGKYIELTFQHVTETLFPLIFSLDDDNISLA